MLRRGYDFALLPHCRVSFWAYCRVSVLVSWITPHLKTKPQKPPDSRRNFLIYGLVYNRIGIPKPNAAAIRKIRRIRVQKKKDPRKQKDFPKIFEGF